MIHDIYIIDDNDEKELTEDLKNIFIQNNPKDEFKIKGINTSQLEVALEDIPSLILINEDGLEKDIIEISKQIREDENNSITPIIVLSSKKEQNHILEILALSIEYYINKPVKAEYLYYIIVNITRLIYYNRRVSPLTGLPGNVQIQAELKKRLLKKEKFAVLYLDLDNFKAYNDIYGFLKGDEIIKFTARVIVKCLHTVENEDNFVGHIGGDDFVAIMQDEDYEIVCQSIIREFDSEIRNYFSDDDIERGFFEVANRKSIIEQFPLTSISIGVVVVDKTKYHNILEIGEVGAQVKHISKTILGSSYSINRRT